MTAVVVGLFTLAAVAGAWGRVGATAWLNRWPFPAGTLAVNATGSFAAGLVAVTAHGDARTILLTGALGALTTYSSFAGEVRAMGADGRARLAVGYGAVTVVGCVVAARLGMAVA